MKHFCFPVICCFGPAIAAASGFCERLPVDPEFPAGLDGQYEIVGKTPNTGSAYTGTLRVTHGNNAYALTRAIQGKSVNGDAWITRCGADKILNFHARYDTKPITEVRCSMGADGDNSPRLTCRTRQGRKTWTGLEAWFQNR